MQKGSGNADAFIILGVLILIAIFSYGAKDHGSGNGFLNIRLNGTSTSSVQPIAPLSNSQISPPSSGYSKSIYLDSGNAAYSYQPYEEYVTISNNGQESVNITGWQLRNAKDKRTYDNTGALQHFAADTATIPQAALFISPYGTSIPQNVTLVSGETAIITTGNPGNQYPYRITSFKENICSGYIENLAEYKFTPTLSSRCPRPADEPGVSNLSTDCRKFIENMSSCHTPEFDTRDSNGEICQNCVDGKPLSNSCVNFIKSHFNYQGCIANHVNDPNFSLKTWRIFLGKGWEMWAKDYENIQLLDQFGKLITSRSY